MLFRLPLLFFHQMPKASQNLISINRLIEKFGVSKMSEKKVVRRSVATVLGIVCIILLVGTVGAVIYYNNVVNDKNATYDSLASTYHDYVNAYSHNNSEYESLKSDYDNYVSTRSHTNSEYNSLNSAYNSYVSTHSHTDSEYNSLNSAYNSYVSTHSHTDIEYNSSVTQIANLQAPKVINVGIIATDNRPLLQTPYLHVSGFVCNVGTNFADNTRLHVVAYQSGGVVAIDTYINIGPIFGEFWQSVSGDLFYDGGALTSWTITPEWT
jgi:hypothetical protein